MTKHFLVSWFILKYFSTLRVNTILSNTRRSRFAAYQHRNEVNNKTTVYMYKLVSFPYNLMSLLCVIQLAEITKMLSNSGNALML